MFGRALEIENVEGDGRGGLVLVFDDAGIKRRCRIGKDAMPYLMRAVANAQASADGVFAEQVKKVLIRPPHRPDEPPVLGLDLEHWPRLQLALSWQELQGLSEAAQETLRRAKVDRGQSN